MGMKCVPKTFPVVSFIKAYTPKHPRQFVNAHKHNENECEINDCALDKVSFSNWPLCRYALEEKKMRQTHAIDPKISHANEFPICIACCENNMRKNVTSNYELICYYFCSLCRISLQALSIIHVNHSHKNTNAYVSCSFFFR